MDPLATWRSIADKVASEDDWEDAIEDCNNLAAWLDSGGFRPSNVPQAFGLRVFALVLSAVRQQRQFHVNPDQSH